MSKTEKLNQTESFKKASFKKTDDSKSVSGKNIDLNNYVRRNKQVQTKLIYGKKLLNPIEEYRESKK